MSSPLFLPPRLPSARERVSISVPIVLPATGYTKAAIEASGKKAVALVDKDGRTLAILRNPEVTAYPRGGCH